ncbi:unnamed protein product [Owenia fusiformis]|uniref:Tyr recombinase domain-containing protein n=1 Tax=Owenia fusiformis TaxID=6347 RepID=A0A8S4NA56_OWEFU|nr:unnamed protein product [Owenia fusiformis]
MLVIFPDQIKELKKQANHNMMSAYNSKTWQNLYTQWRTFLLFCVYYNMAFLPVQTDTILIYMQFLSRTFKSVSSILNYVNGIKVLHLLHELPFPLLNREFQYKLLYKGLQRNNLHTVKRALPITPEILTQIFGSLDLTSDLESTFWFLILTLTFLFARAGNIIPYTTSTFENNKHLLQQDIFKQDSDGLIFLIKHSKTNQAAQRILTLPVLAKESSPLNIVSAFNHKNSFHKYKKTSPAFLYSKNGKLITFTRQKFVKILRNKLRNLGYNPSFHSGHSCRRGGASWAFNANVTGEAIKAHGDWASQCYLRYIELNIASKLAVSQRMLAQI